MLEESPASNASGLSAAISPISANGMATVVNGGSTYWPMSVSPQPTIDGPAPHAQALGAGLGDEPQHPGCRRCTPPRSAGGSLFSGRRAAARIDGLS